MKETQSDRHAVISSRRMQFSWGTKTCLNEGHCRQEGESEKIERMVVLQEFIKETPQDLRGSQEASGVMKVNLEDWVDKRRRKQLRSQIVGQRLDRSSESKCRVEERGGGPSGLPAARGLEVSE